MAKKKVTAKKVSSTPRSGSNCGSCRSWGIIGGIIMVLLGIALYANVLTLSGTVAILLILGGIISVIGCGLKK